MSSQQVRTSDGVCVGLVEAELHLAHDLRDVLVAVGLHVDGPAMRVVADLLREQLRGIPVDNRLDEHLVPDALDHRAAAASAAAFHFDARDELK